ncbi:hypothetical protein HWV62_39589 [Athelia sp. TMB]|nr:hypothetical protein HWV62_39589 [Athelia sp. TMB]
MAMWGPTAQSAILPLYLMFSIAWSFEMVTHLEELCFWLFLVNAGSAQQDWFRSLYFKTWLFGSAVACLYMPLVTIFTRSDPLKCEAYTFLAGSLGSLSLTLWFTPVLWTFPAFLKNLRREGVDKDTVVRLTKFHELNTLRIVFRFLFCLPLVALGIDGVRPHQHVNENMMAVDILAMVAAIGCVVSSAITLVIFFPRSIEGEMAAKQLARERRSRTGGSRTLSRPPSMAPSHAIGGGVFLDPSALKDAYSLPPDTYPPYEGPPTSPEKYGWAAGELELDSTRDSQATASPSIPLRPNRREPETPMSLATLSEENIIKHNRRHSRHNHLLYNYTSPIDISADVSSDSIDELNIPGAFPGSGTSLLKTDRAQVDNERLPWLTEFLNKTHIAHAQETYDQEHQAAYEEERKSLQELENRRAHLGSEQGLTGLCVDDGHPNAPVLRRLAAVGHNTLFSLSDMHLVGSGAFGSVYRALDRKSGTLVAAKEIKLFPSLHDQIINEIDIMRSIEHPNVVEYLGTAIFQDRVYIIEEYCEGGSLAALLQRDRIEDEALIQVYTWQILEAVAWLHARGIIHRDIKLGSESIPCPRLSIR